MLPKLIIATIFASFSLPIFGLQLDELRSVSLRLKSTADVFGERVYVGDVATCVGEEELCAGILGVDLGEAPTNGKTTKLDSSAIRAFVEADSKGIMTGIEGPAAVEIHAASREIPAKDLQIALQQLLNMATDQDDHWRFRVNTVQVIQSPKLSHDNVTWEFVELEPLVRTAALEEIGRTLLTSSNLTVNAKAADENDQLATFSIRAQVEVERLMPVPVRNINPKILITHDLVDQRWVRLPRNFLNLIGTMDGIVGFQAKSSLRPGTPVATNQVEVLQVIKRGQLVRAMSHREGLSVGLRVKSMGAGGIGQEIEVHYLTGNRKFRARIIDAETVEVTL